MCDSSVSTSIADLLLAFLLLFFLLLGSAAVLLALDGSFFIRMRGVVSPTVVVVVEVAGAVAVAFVVLVVLAVSARLGFFGCRGVLADFEDSMPSARTNVQYTLCMSDDGSMPSIPSPERMALNSAANLVRS
jgi:hypothetical protein